MFFSNICGCPVPLLTSHCCGYTLITMVVLIQVWLVLIIFKTINRRYQPKLWAVGHEYLWLVTVLFFHMLQQIAHLHQLLLECTTNYLHFQLPVFFWQVHSQIIIHPHAYANNPNVHGFPGKVPVSLESIICRIIYILISSALSSQINIGIFWKEAGRSWTTPFCLLKHPVNWLTLGL